jgi:hypothetical protein
VKPLLNHRRWWWHRQPFPHVRALNVFKPEMYAELNQAFLHWQAESGGGRELADHDLQGTTLTARNDGPLTLFTSRGWHDLLARLFDVKATGHVNVGLHHHRPGGDPGFPHTDVNPAWFPADEVGDGVLLADPARVEYTTGKVHDPSTSAVQVVRAVAVLFYLANPPWEPEHRGETGLFRDTADEPEDAVDRVPPHSNSLLAFECTPASLHGFCGGGSASRNSIVHWLHRERQDAVRRWGAAAIVDYGGRQ